MKVKTHITNRWDAGPHVFLSLYRKHSCHQFVEGEADVLFLIFGNETGYRSRFKDVPVVTRCDGLYCHSIRGKDSKRLNGQALIRYDLASGVVYQSKYCKALYEHYTGRKLKVPFVILVNGTDVPYYKNERTPSVLCNTAPRDIKRSHIIRVVAKRLETLAKGARVYVIGDTSLQGSNIVPLGKVPKNSLLQYYAQCSTFLHTAYRDACPNSVVEACAAGMVVVGSESGGVPDIVKDTGLLFHEKAGVDDLGWMDKVTDPDVDEITHMVMSSFLMQGRPRPDLSVQTMVNQYDKFLEKIGDC